MEVNKTYNYSEIKGFSKLFIDFIQQTEFMMSRFRSNENLFKSKDRFIEKADNFKFRKELIEILDKSNEGYNFCSEQQANLEKLKVNNCLAVVTGQQVGFLGGPLYTMLKASSAISLTNKLNRHYPEIGFVPVFWVEDNDHDGLEASRAYSITGNEIAHFTCDTSPNQESHRIVSRRIFDENINSEIEKFIASLKETQHKAELLQLLKEIYKPDKSWNSAFINLMNRIFGEEGLLIISASAVIESGICKPLIWRELEAPNKSFSIIMEANRQLELNGYHIQAKANPVNLFYHSDSKRLRIETDDITNNSLIKEANEHPERFSPNVLLRPIFQDFTIPTAAYIAGPGEIGYCSQITELYDYFEVEQPAYLPRHSATLIDTKIEKYISRYDLSPEYFLRDKNDILSDISHNLLDKELDLKIKDIIDEINNLFNELGKISSEIDFTLSASVKSSGSRTIQSIDNIEKKIISALKKKNSEIIQQYLYCSNLLYPNGSLQERVISSLYFINQTGIEHFRELLRKITELDNRGHHFVTIK